MSTPPVSTSLDTASPSVTQKRISKACDACQARKVRCLPIDALTSDQAICEGCLKRGETCTFEAERKKRGPVPRSYASARRAPVPILAKHDSENESRKRRRESSNTDVQPARVPASNVHAQHHDVDLGAGEESYASSSVMHPGRSALDVAQQVGAVGAESSGRLLTARPP